MGRIGDFLLQQGRRVRDALVIILDDSDDASTVATVDELAVPTSARERSQAAIQRLREEDDKIHPMALVFWKVTAFLVGFPVISFYVIKATGVLDVVEAIPTTQIAFQQFDFPVLSMTMSDDGSVVAVGGGGCVNVFRAKPWDLTHEICEDESDLFGIAVSLSETGNVVAVSGVRQDGTRPGFVRTYSLDDRDWNAIGQDLVGELHTDFFGISTSVSGSGDMLAIGIPGSMQPFREGQVQVYALNTTRQWDLIGDDVIRGLNSPDRFGEVVALSQDGDRLAIGAPSPFGTGSVEVYGLEGGEVWTRVGSPIIGLFKQETLGQSISIVNEESTITVAASSRSLSDAPSRVQVFQLVDEDTWEQLSNDVVYSFADEVSVDLSTDGEYLAVGVKDISALLPTPKANTLWTEAVNDPLPLLGGLDVSISTTTTLCLAASGFNEDGDFVVVYDMDDLP